MLPDQASPTARGGRAAGGSRDPGTGLVCTVTTLWDSLANVQSFVSRNLAAGADHMFIFLDASAPDVREFLESLDTVTVVRTGKGFWQGRRSRSLNGRQLANANFASYLLSPFDNVRWLFHLDGDESLHIDRDELLAASRPACPAVRLEVLESVSKAHWDGPVDKFKRTPTPDELDQLTGLGAISSPDLRSYFHGYARGKVGLRPTLDLRLGIHDVWDRDGNRVETVSSPGWNVLHYDCWSSEEFMRKWASPMSNRRANFSGKRERLRIAVNAVLEDTSLGDEERRRQLMDLYEATIADDVAALEEVGLLVTSRPELHGHQPQGLGDDRDAVHRLLDHLAAVDKRHFQSPKPEWHPRGLFDELRRGGSLDSELDDRLAGVLAPS